MIRLSWSNILLWALHAVTIACIASKTNSTVPEPYMDEIFHITQAKAYCRGQWKQWDPKLTTPPGLYLPSAFLSYFLSMPLCSVSALRAVNATLVILLPFLLCDTLVTIRHPSKRTGLAMNQTFKEALGISCFPLVYFFGFLYYTDVASLFVVLLSYHQALRHNYMVSALIGLFSLLFRQTNILWVAFIAFEALDSRLQRLRHEAYSAMTRRSGDLQGLRISSLPNAIWQLGVIAISNPVDVLRVGLPYIPVGAAFLAFVRWNGGIVLGDKTMHVAVLHIPQLYYFTLFACFMAAPFLLDSSLLKKSLRTTLGSPVALLSAACASATIAWTVKHYTIEHPFLLADNRHYPFYIWRRIINVHPYARYALAPAYWGGTVMLFHSIGQARSWNLLPLLAFAAVTALALVPSPLLEFRYFIVPFVILRLHMRPTKRWQVFGEFSLYTAINLVTLWVFWSRPFKWPTEGGWQRFMW